MTILEPSPPVLDQGVHEFISTFMMHVATVSGYGMNRIVTIARIKTLLLAALARGDGAPSTAWSALYRAISELVTPLDPGYDKHSAQVYLQSFISENGDLDHD